MTKKIKRSLLMNENTLLLVCFFLGGGVGGDLECSLQF